MKLVGRQVGCGAGSQGQERYACSAGMGWDGKGWEGKGGERREGKRREGEEGMRMGRAREQQPERSLLLDGKQRSSYNCIVYQSESLLASDFYSLTRKAKARSQCSVRERKSEREKSL